VSIEIRRHGVLFVVSAPSGGGKSTVIERLRKDDPSLGYSVSATTRPPRAGEVHGKSYYFFSDAEFDDLIRKQSFYEWAHVHNRRYGTLRHVVDAELAQGHDVLLDIDVQGGLKIKRTRDDAVLIFLLPPSMSVLEQRLRGRKSDSDDVIAVRLANARKELACALAYDYALVNDNLDEAVSAVRSIVDAERRRAARLTILTEGEDVRIEKADLFSAEHLFEQSE